MPQFSRLLLFHALRPDRLTAAMSKFVSDTLGGCRGAWVAGGWGWIEVATALHLLPALPALCRHRQTPASTCPAHTRPHRQGVRDQPAVQPGALVCGRAARHPHLRLPVAGRGRGGQRGGAGPQAGLHRRGRQLLQRVAGPGSGATAGGRVAGQGGGSAAGAVRGTKQGCRAAGARLATLTHPPPDPTPALSQSSRRRSR